MVNTRSQSNNNILEAESPNKALAAFLYRLNENIEHIIKEKQIDIDNFQSESVTGVINLADQVRTPYKVTDIFAFWNQSAFPTPVNSTVDTTFAAAASGSASLPGGNAITGFTVSVGPGVAAALTTVTVSNVVGGPLTYEFESPAAGGETTLNINFPNPLLPVFATQITVTFNGTANTGAGSIEVTGQSLVTAPTVTIKIGQRTFQPNPASGQFSLLGMAGMQVLIKDPISLTITPAVQCHFEVIGYADYRKIDTP